MNGRRFPWRGVDDPYRIFIAEVMLHRTRAENVVPVYERFLERFPDAESLVGADMMEVADIMDSLGLRWRSKLLKESFIDIVERFHGKIPVNKSDLLSLPGVGDYISSAVSLFAGGSREVLIDTNTLRVICRINGETVTDSRRKDRRIREVYSRLLNNSDPVTFAYSMIDLASLICTPKNPRCLDCPVHVHCTTYATRTAGSPLRADRHR
ncbi:DNA-binding protein [Caldiplasma sukawensis]